MFIVKIGVLSLVAVCLSYCSGCTNAAGEKLSCRSMQVEGGIWICGGLRGRYTDLSALYTCHRREDSLCIRRRSLENRQIGVSQVSGETTSYREQGGDC